VYRQENDGAFACGSGRTPDQVKALARPASRLARLLVSGYRSCSLPSVVIWHGRRIFQLAL
jgi:hypothetical protein